MEILGGCVALLTLEEMCCVVKIPDKYYGHTLL
jgi:hypothetical protein